MGWSGIWAEDYFFMSRLKKIIIKIDEKRENAEDFIANNVLAKWDNFQKADDIRKQVNLAIINLACGYVATYGVTVPDNVKNSVAIYGVKLEKLLNKKLQKQLKKKSKIYKENHE